MLTKNRLLTSTASVVRGCGGWSHANYVPTRRYAEAASPGAEKSKPSPAVTEELKKAWKAVAPILDFPKVPSNFLKQRPPVPATIPAKLTLNFVLPRKSHIEEVDMVTIPASTGVMGVLPGHVPTVVEIKPELLSIQNGAEVTKYVVSGGYAFIHANSVTDIMAEDGYPPENFDIEEAKKALS
ncbi:hypothetical protein R1sor_003799 [Riccia sorocarpa]|uniref:ATP synthase F1 complex delta/epsilon subunit N-terminal domain-containing protein n=1 Tax=Riccia sorocarpa TaxID=122646 RepID=A0ABD3H5I9_9MARC